MSLCVFSFLNRSISQSISFFIHSVPQAEPKVHVGLDCFVIYSLRNENVKVASSSSLFECDQTTVL